jgi:crotonobetainyl-CoA:carnitine CoA-transferase CaiB-like acyl-CoA transferase
MTTGRASSGELPLRQILEASGWRDAPLKALTVTDDADLIPTRYPIEAMGVAAIAAVGLAVYNLWRLRGGAGQDITVNRKAAALAMASSDYLLVDGVKVKTWDPVTGFYQDRNGDWIYLHGNFPHLRDGLLTRLGSGNDPESIKRAVADREVAELEHETIEQGLCASVARTRAEWLRHAQHEAVLALPLLEITRIGDAPPQPLPPGMRPLSGVRVVDCSRVIAGPMAGRTLAEHGADVLRINGPHLPYIEPLIIDTGLGKRSCHLDLRAPDDAGQLRALVSDADIFVDAYRPGALAERGFGADALHDLRPGIISVSLSAWSRLGPWSARRGYDSLVQAACGLTLNEGDSAPSRMPCAPLDYLAGYLAAYGAMVALARRAEEGGSWRVELSLLRIAEWIFDMADALGVKSTVSAAMPGRDEIGAFYQSRPSEFGRLDHLAPAMTLSGTPPGWDRPPVRPGTDRPVWL